MGVRPPPPPLGGVGHLSVCGYAKILGGWVPKLTPPPRVGKQNPGLYFTSVTQSVASVLRTDRRQDSAVWRAFRRLRLPPQALDFIYRGLWKKLPVGKCLHAFFPWFPPTCPFEGAQEDVYQRLKACSWLTIPVRVLQCTFLAVRSVTGRAPISRLCIGYPLLSLTRALELLL